MFNLINQIILTALGMSPGRGGKAEPKGLMLLLQLLWRSQLMVQFRLHRLLRMTQCPPECAQPPAH